MSTLLIPAASIKSLNFSISLVYASTVFLLSFFCFSIYLVYSSLIPLNIFYPLLSIFLLFCQSINQDLYPDYGLGIHYFSPVNQLLHLFNRIAFNIYEFT